MRRLIRVASRLTEGVAAAMMAAMFLTFLLQIAIRYIVGSEWFAARLGHVVDASAFGWTLEFCLALWLWIVLWGNAFVVRERDHVTFDILYLAAGPTVRRVLVMIGAAVIVVAFLSSVLPTYDKLRILRLKSSASLPVKMFPIYSIYFVFLVAVAGRYAWRFAAAARGRIGGEGHHHLEITDE